jgi:hypothetical protein
MKITQPKQPVSLALNADASGVGVSDPGGLFGGLDNLQAILEAWASGTLGAYLTVNGGGKGIPFDLDPMGSAKAVDWANGNLGYGELTEACTITTVGWTNGRDCWTALELTGGSGGPHLPTVSGVTWKTDPPTAVATGDVSHILLHSRDGGTTIWGWTANGGGGADKSLEIVAASGSTETIDVSVARSYEITLTADCTFTLTGAVAGEAWFVTVARRQGAGAPWLETWPGSVIWPGGVAPVLSTTADDVDFATLVSFDGGTVWFGFPAGGGGGSAIEVLDEGVSLTAALASMNFVGNGVTATTSGDDVTVTIPGGATGSDTQMWRPVMDGLGNVVTDSGTGEAIMAFG